MTRIRRISTAITFVAVMALMFFGLGMSTIAAQETGDSFIEPSREYYRAEVVSILEEGERDAFGIMEKYQLVELKFLSGERRGETVQLEHIPEFQGQKALDLETGDRVVVQEIIRGNEFSFAVTDRYRLPRLWWVLIGAVVVLLVFTGWHGFRSLLGLGLSIMILAIWIIPRILAGWNPLLVTISGGLAIMALAFYVTHGWTRRTHIMMVSTTLILLGAWFLAELLVSGMMLSGNTDEAVQYLTFLGVEGVDVRGLLLSGIIIGTSGVLDDVIVTQVATVEKIKQANQHLTSGKLYQMGLGVGKHHIASMINTLALAYAGAALPLFLLLTAQNTEPLWVVLSSELIVEEIVRTLVGSVALILAVPVSTWLAVRYVAAREGDGHVH